MAIPPDSLTLKREYLARKIRAGARAAGVPLDDLRWDRPAAHTVSVLIIASAGREKTYTLSHLDDPPSRGLVRLTDSELDILAEKVVFHFGSCSFWAARPNST